MIQKQIATSNGPANYHVLFKVESLRPGSMLTLTIDSYSDEATFLANGGLMSRKMLAMPSPTGAGAIFDDAENWLLTDAGSPYQGGQIVADMSDTLEAMRTRKVVEMSQRCADAILAGFVSSALGAAYRYPSDPEDQANLTASVLDSTLPGNDASWLTAFKCMDSDGVRAYRMHTASQIQAVGKEGKAAITAALLKNEQLRAQILAADAVELAAIGWPA